MARAASRALSAPGPLTCSLASSPVPDATAAPTPPALRATTSPPIAMCLRVIFMVTVLRVLYETHIRAGQLDPHVGAAPFAARHARPTPVRAGDSVHDGQAEPGAAARA